MKKLLHIVATPRDKDSRTLKVSTAFIDAFKAKYPGSLIDELNLFSLPLMPLTVKTVAGKYLLLSGGTLSAELKEAWAGVESQIKRFLSVDGYLVSSPMWNFSVPYPLKHYLDIIIQPGYLFQYTSGGVEGLVKNKKMVVITSRGGDYSPGTPYSAYDFQEPYLRAIFGFVGITAITFINAQPMDALGEAIRDKKIEEAKVLAKKTANSF